MRSTLWRSLPSARSRGARPSSTQASTAGTIVSRNDSESAACTRSASGQPPSSCTCTSPAVPAQVLVRAALAQPGGDHVGAAVLVPAVVLRRVPAHGAVPARRRVRVRALDVVRGGRDPRRLGRVGSSSSSQCSVRSRWQRVRMDLVHPGPALLEQLAHCTVTGLACSTKISPPSIANSMSCGAEPLLEVVADARQRAQLLLVELLLAALLPQLALLDAAARGGHDRERLPRDLRALERPVALERVVVGRDLAGDRRLAEPEHGLDHHPVAPVVDRVAGEEHAGHVGVHHPLHHDRHVEVVERALALAVEQRALGEERGPAVAHAREHVAGAAHVQVRLLLAGVGGGLAVLGARARAHGDRRRRRPAPRTPPRSPRGGSAGADDRLRALVVGQRGPQLRAAVAQRGDQRTRPAPRSRAARAARSAVMRASDAPLPPARATSVQASSSKRSISPPRSPPRGPGRPSCRPT